MMMRSKSLNRLELCTLLTNHYLTLRCLSIQKVLRATTMEISSIIQMNLGIKESRQN
nr:MAG TPA: hypothetical protein [Caudoviricetes sp.]DAP80512.1 MAG TPA: hypothetical protein [Caudoviricetes sp.]